MSFILQKQQKGQNGSSSFTGLSCWLTALSPLIWRKVFQDARSGLSVSSRMLGLAWGEFSVVRVGV